MKNIVTITLAFSLVLSLSLSAEAQLGGLMNKVKNKIVEKALGTDSGSKASQSTSVGQEPSCAGEGDRVIFEFEKGYKVKMNEITVCIQNGDILLYSKMEKKYFVKKKNSDSPEGPFEANNPEVKRFVCDEVSSEENEDITAKYSEYIVRSGEKYLIKFGGKTYGPYAIIQNFVVSSLKTKFVAQVVLDVILTPKEGAQLEKESKNATMAQQMEMAKKIQEKMMQKAASGNPMDFSIKIVSNVPDIAEDLGMTNTLSSAIKYDEIVWVEIGKILDLSGKTIFTFDPQRVDPNEGLWLSSDNKRYATYTYGDLKFSDGQECTDVFSPYIMKENGKTVLNYLYYSPKHNAIMQISTPF